MRLLRYALLALGGLLVTLAVAMFIDGLATAYAD